MSGIVNTSYTDLIVDNRVIKALVIGGDGLNENDGIFAISLEKYQRYSRNKRVQILCNFYTGDDGSWKKIWTCDFHFIVQIAQCLLIAIDLKDKLLEGK